jgi:hypothetical protein
VDSVALLLIALTALLGPICVLASYTAITTRVKTYYAWLLVLQAAMTGVFASRDIIFFYICFEFTLIPMWILIHLYGSTNRKKAATKFFLYTFTGSMIALAGLVYVAWTRIRAGGAWNFDFVYMQKAALDMSPREQAWVLLALLAGFAVKVPLFPLHTWLPLAHTEAPTAGSVILAGVLLKLGTYGIYRFAIPLCPVAAAQYAPAIAVLSIIGIIYAGLICWVQTDVKKLVAYSSVAHLGFCILGMFSFNTAGLTGSVLYMINHGLSTGPCSFSSDDLRAVPHAIDEGAGRPGVEDADLGHVHGLLHARLRGAAGPERVCERVPVPAGHVPGRLVRPAFTWRDGLWPGPLVRLHRRHRHDRRRDVPAVHGGQRRLGARWSSRIMVNMTSTAPCRRTCPRGRSGCCCRWPRRACCWGCIPSRSWTRCRGR